jgi:anaerobic selenocysteine-containing dehydrogenase
LINSLVLLSGHIGRRGGGSYFHLHSTGHFNMQWARTCVRTKQRSFQLACIGSELLKANGPKISMLWVNGTNIINQAADSHQVISAFESIPFMDRFYL